VSTPAQRIKEAGIIERVMGQQPVMTASMASSNRGGAHRKAPGESGKATVDWLLAAVG
jgi:hypothetical protein